MEIGEAGEIIKRSQSVTHRLLSVNTDEDQTRPCSETPHDNSLSLPHIHMLYMNRDKCECAIQTCKNRYPLRFLHQCNLLNLYFYPEIDRSQWKEILPCTVNVLVCGKERLVLFLHVYSCWIMREATVASFQVKQSFWACWDKVKATIKCIMWYVIPINCADMDHQGG